MPLKLCIPTPPQPSAKKPRPVPPPPAKAHRKPFKPGAPTPPATGSGC
jgi:hypothetical protein